MKKIRVVLSLLLIALICAAWLLQISRTRENNQAYRSFVTEADRLREEKLYQQANPQGGAQAGPDMGGQNGGAQTGPNGQQYYDADYKVVDDDDNNKK